VVRLDGELVRRDVAVSILRGQAWPASKRRWHNGEHPGDLRHLPRRSAQRHARLRSAGRERHAHGHDQGRVQRGAVSRQATINRSTTVYSTTGELAGTGNYTQGGIAVTNANAPANTGGTGIVAFWTPSASLSWANLTSSGAFDAMLLYNASNTAKNAVAVFTFGSQSVTAGTFTLTMPTNDLTNGLIRIS
jgi:hypothetical protein